MVIPPEAQPRSVSGREVRAHPHHHHSGHRSSLAGCGESDYCGLPLVATVCPGLPMCIPETPCTHSSPIHDVVLW